MTHRRKTLRDLIVGYLTGLTTTGSNVSARRVYAQKALPSLNVIIPDEEMQENLRYRDAVVRIEIRAKLTGSMDDQLDSIAEEVETALEANYTLDGDCAQLVYSRMESEVTAEESEKPIGLMTLEYTLKYIFTPGA